MPTSLPDRLANRLVQQAGLSAAEVATMNPEEAILRAAIIQSHARNGGTLPSPPARPPTPLSL